MYYEYVVAAHRMFGNITSFDPLQPMAQSFDNIGTTAQTMFQLFIGDWQSVMVPIVNATNRGVVWFFVSYILVVSVLFTNLFIGIILRMYALAYSQIHTYRGQFIIQLADVLGGRQVGRGGVISIYT